MSLSNFQQRAITGAVFVAVMLTAVQFHLSIALLSIIISCFCVWELARMFKVPAMMQNAFTLISAIVLFFLNFSEDLKSKFNILIDTSNDDIILAMGTGILALSIISRNWLTNKQILWMFFGTIYIYIGCRTFYLVGSIPADPTHLKGTYINKAIFVLVITWCNDVFAYLIGRKFGKTPLMPSISPKKTIEGTLGGLLFAGIASLIMIYIENLKYEPIYFIIGIIIGIAATIGDLIESKAKRIAGVKDSGTILPGHGGFLDRFDAMLHTMPVYWILIHT